MTSVEKDLMMVPCDIDISAALAALATRPELPVGQQKVRREARSLLAEEELVEPVYSYQIVPVRKISGELLSLEHGRLRAPGLADLAFGLVSIAAVVCSLSSTTPSVSPTKLRLRMCEPCSSRCTSTLPKNMALLAADISQQGLCRVVRDASNRSRWPIVVGIPDLQKEI